MRGQGKVEVQHGGPGRSARRRANDLGNGSQHERKPPIEAAQIMNECDMCSESLPGFNRDLLSWGGLPGACRRKEWGTKLAVKPAAASFQF
jgi:hypothetical protein